ncbi:MAG: polysaccharide pyruvyl transferase family protein [Pseudomonadota bacterium]|nr:polysaccharide pyruvyl transferase family protein [Pseudomonadota bacterium]
MEQYRPKIWLIGASFTTTNLGVSALAESSLKCIFSRWPHADVILRTREDEATLEFVFGAQTVSIKKRELTFRKHPLKTDNATVILFYILLVKLLPFKGLREFITARNPHFKDLIEAEFIIDITGGDSFSDIYGRQRFFIYSLLKWIMILPGGKFIFFPQTYGPFKHKLTQKLARYLLARATAIYARDQEGVTKVKQLLAQRAEHKLIRFVPDVAFVLDAQPPENSPALAQVAHLKTENKQVIGLNISGLIYNDGVQAQEKFNLHDDYRLLVKDIIQLFLAKPDTVVFLVPHVYATPEHFESDPRACQHVYSQLANEYSDRLFLLEENFDHREVKYFIRQCDFFMGTRMHACIAALSQGIPVVGIAYSGKFFGVFESVGVQHSVLDLRTQTNAHILTQIETLYAQRQATAQQLNTTVPAVQEQVLSFLNEIEP